jgi:hypothetical protein
VEDGDRIAINSVEKTIEWLDVSDEEKARRRQMWESSGKNQLNVKRGVLYRYARDVAVSAYTLVCRCRAEDPFKVCGCRRLLRLKNVYPLFQPCTVHCSAASKCEVVLSTRRRYVRVPELGEPSREKIE